MALTSVRIRHSIPLYCEDWILRDCVRYFQGFSSSSSQRVRMKSPHWQKTRQQQQLYLLSIFGIRLLLDAGCMIELNIFDFTFSSLFFKSYLTTETDAKYQNGKMALRRVGWHHNQANHLNVFQTATVNSQRRRLKRFICEICKSKSKTIIWICASMLVQFFSFFAKQVLFWLIFLSFFDCLVLLYSFCIEKRLDVSFCFEEKKWI